MADGKTLPPVPYKSPLVDNSGFLTPPWATFFRQVFQRIGGPIALSNIELESLQLQEISGLEDEVDALQVTVSSQSTQISNLQTLTNDLGQGPEL